MPAVPVLSFDEAVAAMKKNREDVPTTINALYSSAYVSPRPTLPHPPAELVGRRCCPPP